MGHGMAMLERAAQCRAARNAGHETHDESCHDIDDLTQRYAAFRTGFMFSTGVRVAFVEYLAIFDHKPYA